jgi:predicted ATP-grasp superfamily ATP-dependent carboligase
MGHETKAITILAEEHGKIEAQAEFIFGEKLSVSLKMGFSEFHKNC